MLRKEAVKAKPRFLPFLTKAILTAEIVFFVGSYVFYKKVNTDRDLRLHLYQNYYWFLDSFYSIGEHIRSNPRAREIDYDIWKKEGKI